MPFLDKAGLYDNQGGAKKGICNVYLNVIQTQGDKAGGRTYT